jgi:hypothetical protein
VATLAGQAQVKVADEVWIVCALLHREHSEQPDFTIDEIMERAKKERITGSLRAGVYVHTIQHCVANRPPNPGRYRMLYETSPGRRRLFRHGDSYHPQREGGKVTPTRDDMPSAYNRLLSWYREWSSVARHNASKQDPLLALRGSGKHLWSDEHADDYVRRLREGWE